MPIKKSITGGLNKLHRDSMGDTGNSNLGTDASGNMQQQVGPNGQMLNFYDQPGNQGKQQTGGHSREREAVIPSAQA
jgi:hypothetical protein